jgi:hypothetical protein
MYSPNHVLECDHQPEEVFIHEVITVAEQVIRTQVAPRYE